MAQGWLRRLPNAIDAFSRTLRGSCAPDCMGTERLERMLSAAPMVLYVLRWTPDHQPLYVSANVERFTGLTAESILADPRRWLAAIHSDDRMSYAKALERLPEHGRFALDYRVRHVEGGWRWVRDEARVKLDARGEPAEVVGSWLDITDRRHSEQALAASEAQVRAAQALLTDALESSGDAFSLFDPQDRLVTFNSRYKEFYQSIADMIRPGVSFAELLLVSAERGQYRGVDADGIPQWLAERMAHHQNALGFFEQQLADGRYLEIVERATMDGGRVAIRRDVTARKTIEEALRRELAFKQTLIDALPFPVYYKDRQGRYLGCNTKFADVVGRPIADIVGSTVADFVSPAKARLYARYDQELLDDQGLQVRDLTLELHDGSIHHMILVKGLFTDGDGQVAGIIGSMIDVTPQKRAEEQLVQTAKLATLGQIASEVAHELNQPLSIIRMSAEHCLQTGLSDCDTLARRMTTIVSQVGRMAEMVDHLRSFSRLEKGEPVAFSPAQVASTAASLLAPQFLLDDIELRQRIDESCPDILGRPNQLEQVVLNLLGNARDAVRTARPPKGGWVGISLSAQGDMVTLEVSDNGGGVPDAMWPHIFDPFFTTKADGAGTGLGLSISVNIVTQMGGTIQGCNRDGGAVFTITVPVHQMLPQETVAPAEPNALPPSRPHQSDGPRPRVLVIDDEELSVECIVEFLAARGFDANGATAPDQALARARAGKPDLMICDLRLPGISGAALVTRLRNELGALPAILMTGGPLPEDLASENTVVLGKPLALREVLDHAERLLAARRQPCES